jgi:hypothetical protein
MARYRHLQKSSPMRRTIQTLKHLALDDDYGDENLQ